MAMTAPITDPRRMLPPGWTLVPCTHCLSDVRVSCKHCLNIGFRWYDPVTDVFKVGNRKVPR